jgi:hypothetical protein
LLQALSGRDDLALIANASYAAVQAAANRGRDVRRLQEAAGIPADKLAAVFAAITQVCWG